MIYCISDVGSVNLVCLHLSQEMVVDARHLFTDLSNGVAIDFAEIQTEVNRIANDLSPFYQHKINDLFLYYSIQQIMDVMEKENFQYSTFVLTLIF